MERSYRYRGNHGNNKDRSRSPDFTRRAAEQADPDYYGRGRDNHGQGRDYYDRGQGQGYYNPDHYDRDRDNRGNSRDWHRRSPDFTRRAAEQQLMNESLEKTQNNLVVILRKLNALEKVTQSLLSNERIYREQGPKLYKMTNEIKKQQEEAHEVNYGVKEVTEALDKCVEGYRSIQEYKKSMRDLSEEIAKCENNLRSNRYIMHHYAYAHDRENRTKVDNSIKIMNDSFLDKKRKFNELQGSEKIFDEVNQFVSLRKENKNMIEKWLGQEAEVDPSL